MVLVGEILILIAILTIVFNNKDKIFILLSIELYFIGIILILIDLSLNFDDCAGLLNSVILLTLSAIESAVGLTILFNRNKLPNVS